MRVHPLHGPTAIAGSSRITSPALMSRLAKMYLEVGLTFYDMVGTNTSLSIYQFDNPDGTAASNTGAG